METRYQSGDVISLGGAEGIIVEGAVAEDGQAEFSVPGGTVSVTVLKCQGPDVTLAGARVWLVEELQQGEPAGRYAVMVDDAWWGLRVQPAQFSAAPLEETLVMGYRLQGRVLQDGDPVAGAHVSLEVALVTAEDGEVLLWDSEEFNELVYSWDLETWVAGPGVLCPIQTDGNGDWEYLAPRGHGALYQRETDLRDESPETAARPLARFCSRVDALHRGHRARAGEGSVAVINMQSAGLRIVGAPGAHVRVGTLDHTGTAYAVPPEGEIVLQGLPACEHSIVQFKRHSWGDWNSEWGCPRVLVTLAEGEETTVELAPLEQYDVSDDIMAGRVYERPGIPAVGLDVVAISSDDYEVVGTVATTDEDGFWSAEIPPDGFGGSLWIHDEKWGSVPVLGSPYSDIVLGARVYSAWLDAFRPEAWRKGEYGHKNFPYVAGAVWVEDPETGETFPTVEGDHGGWITEEALPRFHHVADLEELIHQGPLVRGYDLVEPGAVLISGLTLGTQPFAGWETPPGNFRASGFYPEVKMLLGGKVHGNVLVDSDAPVTEALPEAARMGLEFGEHRPHVEVRVGPRDEPLTRTGCAGMLCPYCGGPSWRDPGPGPALQGYCVQCALAYDHPAAMDCRTYFSSPAVGGTERLGQRVVAPMREGWLVRSAGYHWRPEMYEETVDYLTQSGPAQVTNAPRWCAVHLDAFSDGRALGRFDGDQSPAYLPGHGLDHFSGLPEIDRPLGLAQFKLVFDAGYVVPQDFTVELDCVGGDGQVETQTVTLRAGLRGPCAETVLGDAVRLTQVPKLTAEHGSHPYAGCGIYRGVADIRLVSPAQAPGCRFTVVSEAPHLASPLGVPVQMRTSTPVALQADRTWGNPHLACDGVGQVLLAYTRDGDVCLHRRGGLADEWDAGRLVTEDGSSDYPWVAKDPRNTLVLVRETDREVTRMRQSLDDGEHWEV